jgi:hypothetical protein
MPQNLQTQQQVSTKKLRPQRCVAHT